MEYFEFEDEDDIVYEGDISIQETRWLKKLGLLETESIKVPLIYVKVQMG